jgi:homoserine O-succinyltransferase
MKGVNQMSQRILQIGILNVMHDKAATNADFRQALTTQNIPVRLHFYYPTTKYKDQLIPKNVQANLQPLDLKAVAKLDAFIITGAPIETIPFEDVTYLEELKALFKVLDNVPTRLYLCWGAMVALNLLYGIEKHLLPQKLFGVYPQEILHESSLLTGLKEGFLAPHARYAESNLSELRIHPDLVVQATTVRDELFLVQNKIQNEAFLFSHLEYQASGLEDEYQREITGHPEIHYRRPEMDSGQTAVLTATNFPWQDTQAKFFENWLKTVAQNAN